MAHSDLLGRLMLKVCLMPNVASCGLPVMHDAIEIFTTCIPYTVRKNQELQVDTGTGTVVGMFQSMFPVTFVSVGCAVYPTMANAKAVIDAINQGACLSPHVQLLQRIDLELDRKPYCCTVLYWYSTFSVLQ